MFTFSVDHEKALKQINPDVVAAWREYFSEAAINYNRIKNMGELSATDGYIGLKVNEVVETFKKHGLSLFDYWDKSPADLIVEIRDCQLARQMAHNRIEQNAKLSGRTVETADLSRFSLTRVSGDAYLAKNAVVTNRVA